MAESDSAINLQYIHDIIPNLVETITPSSSVNLSNAEASTSVAGPASSFSYDFQINYNESLEQKIGALMNTEMCSDVKLLIGEEKVEIRAHKLILALSSPVFTSMFYSPLLESQNVIEIPDCRPEAFQALVLFLYKGENVPLHLTNVEFLLSVLYVARKYAVKILEDICAVNLSTLISIDNVFDVLNASNLHCLSILETECWAFIEDNAKLVLEKSILNMDADILNLILNNEKLNINEVELFELLVQWMENECFLQDLLPNIENKLTVGGKLLELIRFPIMTATEFADSVVPTKMLKVENVAKIFTYISTSPQNKGNYEMEFSVQKRQPRILFSFHQQSQVSLSDRQLFTFKAERTENIVNENLVGLEEERPRSRGSRSRRSRRRSRVGVIPLTAPILNTT